MRTIFDNIIRCDGVGLDFMSEAYGGMKIKPWILTAVGMAGSLASSLIGGNASAKAAEAARKEEERRNARANAYWNRKANESYLDTSAGQNTVRMARDFADENWKKTQGAAAVSGGTDASVAQAKEAGNRMMANTVANLAAQDTARKDAAERGMMNEDATHSQAVQANEMQRAANISQTAGALSDSFISGLSSLDNQFGGKVDNAAGSLFKKK